MGKTLTVAQKTFTDLYDSYVLNLSSDIVAVPCDQYGKATEDYTTTITYIANIGTQPVGIQSCTVIEGTVPSYEEDDTIMKVHTNTIIPGEITITVPKGMLLDDDSEVGFTFTTNNNNAFTFVRYITFVKIKSGERVVTFQIKSEKGDTFQEGINEITLETVAFDGLTEITSDQAEYKWYYYNADNDQWVTMVTGQGSQGTGADQGTPDNNASSLRVARGMVSESSIFRCVMTYPKDSDNDYEDYFSLKKSVNNYEAVVKFFDGSNTIDASDPFVVAYLELYKDQQPVSSEILKPTAYFYDPLNRRNDAGELYFETSKIKPEYQTEGRYMYFIYEDEPNAYVNTYTITTGVVPEGAGTVTGAGPYEANTIPTVYAMSNPGYIFDHWRVNGVDTSITDSTYPGEPLIRDMSIVAVFAQNLGGEDEVSGYFVSITKTPSAGGTTSGGGLHTSGSSITLEATPNSGYIFDDWYSKNEETNTWVKLNWPASTQLTVTKTWNLMAKFIQEGQENASYFSALIVAQNASNGDVVCLSRDVDGIEKLYKTQLTSEDSPFYFYAKADTGRVITGARLEMTLPPISLPEFPNVREIDQTFDAQELVENGQLTPDYTVFTSKGEDLTPVWYGYMGKWTIYFDSADNVKTYDIGVQAYPAEGGIVTGGGKGLASGTSVTLVATPNSGYRFEGWADDAAAGASRVVTVGDSNITYMAIFEQIPETKYTITTVADPSDGGTVYGGGEYSEGTSVDLLAVAADGYKFVRWTNGVLTSKQTITVLEDKTYTAKFTEATTDYMLAMISATNVGTNDRYYVSKSVNSTDYSKRSEQVYLNETAYYYAQAGDDREIASITMLDQTYSAEDMLSDPDNQWLSSDKKTLMIEFPVALSAFIGTTLNVIVTFRQIAGSGSGSTTQYVTITTSASPSYGGTVTGGGRYESGTLITLAATPADGYYLNYWLDDEGNNDLSRTITVGTSDETYTAIFKLIPTDQYTITTIASPLEGGRITGGGTYPYNTTITLTAIPNSGYTFSGWTDNPFLTSSERDVVVSGDKTYTAKFGNSGDSGSGSGETVTITTDQYVQVYVNGVNVTNSSHSYTLNVGDSLQLVAYNPGYTLNYWHHGDFMPGLSDTTLNFTVSTGMETVYQTTWTSGYSAAPMMMSVAPTTMSLEDEGIATYAAEATAIETTSSHAKYKVALYQYNQGTWNLMSDGLQYRYTNDLYSDVESNVIVISKNDITNRRDINFTILPKVLGNDGKYVNDNDLIVARASFTVFDLNDPIVSNTEPLNPRPGQIWLNTSQSPYKLYIYQDKDKGWKYFDQQNGRRVYTSRQQLIDEGYTEGDLWILGKGEQCVIPRESGTGSDTYNEGSMLRSKVTREPYGFNESDWFDAMSGLTTLKNNINQTFTFDTQRGLKIGQQDNNFYVNISSTKMSFYDNSAGQEKEVVYISNNSANIDNMVVDGGAEFNCNVKLNEQLEFGMSDGGIFTSKFALQLEDDGSLSLVVAT